MIISTDMWTITPNVAAKLLENNPSNRPVSRTKVAEYIRQLLNGEWQTTHQGILLGKGDILLDGQHRLLAIVECGVAVKCLVSRDDERTSPVDLMVDAGLLRRSVWISGKQNKIWAEATVLVAVGIGAYTDKLTQSPSKKPSRAAVSAVCDRIQALHSELVTDSRVGFSNAPIKAAFILHMITNRDMRQRIADQYRLLIKDERKGLWPALETYSRQRCEKLIKREKGEIESRFYPFLVAHSAIEYGVNDRDVSFIRIYSPGDSLDKIQSRIRQEFARELANKLPKQD